MKIVTSPNIYFNSKIIVSCANDFIFTKVNLSEFTNT